MTTAIPAGYDPARPEWRDDPYPIYRALRDGAPVYYAPQTRVWLVSRYEDVMHVLRTPEDYSSRAMFTFLMNQGREGRPPISWKMLKFVARLVWKTRLNPMEFSTARNLIATDGNEHLGMRNIVNRGFTPRRIASWEDRAREIVDRSMQRLREGQDFDIVKDLAIPLPVEVIAEMLGVEPERRDDFKRWSDAIIETATGSLRDEPFNQQMTEAIIPLIAYVRNVAEERKRNPSDDLVSVIVAEQEGDTALTIREVVQFVTLILVAGNETTTNLIGNAVTALLDNPDQLELLAREPGRIPAAVEEALRFDAPVQLVFRTTTRDVELAGTSIPAGSFVAPLIGSANRDERQFPDPDRFDVRRDPKGHVGFGFGAHFCLGASLARLETKIALEALIPELLGRQLSEPTEIVDSFLVRGRRELGIRPETQRVANA